MQKTAISTLILAFSATACGDKSESITKKLEEAAGTGAASQEDFGSGGEGSQASGGREGNLAGAAGSASGGAAGSGGEAACQNAFICMDEGDCEESCETGSCSNACDNDADCNDLDAATIDTCLAPGSCDSACSYATCESSCAQDSDCNDDNPLTEDVCKNPDSCESYCQNSEPCAVACGQDSDCDDSESLTADTCKYQATCDAFCAHVALQCVVAQDCDDDDICTIDSCSANTCSYASACPDGDCSDELQKCADVNGYRHPYLKVAQTQDIVNQEATTLSMEIVSNAISPYALRVDGIAGPTGMRLLSLDTTSCGPSGDKVKCRHFASFAFDGNCTGNGEYRWRLSYECFDDALCETMSPSYTEENIVVTRGIGTDICSSAGN